MWTNLVELWTTVVYEPLFNLLSGLVAFLPGNNLGVALIILALLTRVVLHPVFKKQLFYTRLQRALQPQVNAIKKANKGNRQQIALETMMLYREHNFKPMAMLGYMLIQLPIVITFFYVIRGIIENSQTFFDRSYSFIQNSTYMQNFKAGDYTLDANFLGIDLSRAALSDNGFYVGSFILVVLFTASFYFVSKQMMMQTSQGVKKVTLREILRRQAAGEEVDQQEIIAAQGRLLTPLFTGILAYLSLTWAVAIPLYYGVLSGAQYLQQRFLIDRTASPVKVAVNGQATEATVQKPLNAKQKKEQRAKGTFRQAEVARKRVPAVVKTSKVKKQPKKGAK